MTRNRSATKARDREPIRRRGRAPRSCRARRGRAGAWLSSRTRRARCRRPSAGGGRCRRRGRSRALLALGSASSRRPRIAKKSKYASQNDIATRRPSSAATITPAVQLDALRSEPDRDQRLADRDDHDQAVALDEVRRLTLQPLRPPNAGADEADGEGGDPERVLQRAVGESRDEDERAPPSTQGATRWIAWRSSWSPRAAERVERRLHGVHEEERDTEHDALVAEGLGTARAATNIAAGGGEQGGERALLRVERVREPCERRPRPTRARSGSAAPCPSPAQVGSWVSRVVTCVNPKTKTRSKKSSSGATGRSPSAEV